jgi:wyosine [tRNA(Phe)-imidazoG37] synthetase (radical SAM superfamily)
MRRREYVTPSEVLPEIRTALSAGGIDTITFSGSGEPTLNSSIGFMIHDVRSWTMLPIAVITNGTLLSVPEVRKDLLEADIVLPSLNAATKNSFDRTNRPHPGLVLETIIQGLRQFRAEFQGRLWLEIFLVRGVNDSPDDLAALKSAVATICPDRIQLNTVVRPPAEPSARRLSPERMEEIRKYFGDLCEVIPEGVAPTGASASSHPDIGGMVSRRPMTAADIAASLNLPLEAVLKQMALLEHNQVVRLDFHDGGWYYRAAEQDVSVHYSNGEIA